MRLPESKIKFIVGLSNGEKLIENEGVLLKDTDSSWWKLQKYLNDNKLGITSMALCSKTEVGNRHYNLPNDKNKFNGLVPLGFNCFRWFASDGLSGDKNIEHYCVAEAMYEDFKVQIWVSELDPDKSWVNIKPVDNGTETKG